MYVDMNSLVEGTIAAGQTATANPVLTGFKDPLGKLAAGAVDPFGNMKTAPGSGPHIDAFARLRVSNPVVLFDAVQKYDKAPLLYDESLTGTATSVHVPAESSTRMTVNASGDRVIRQSKRYIFYTPGRSQMVLQTGVLGPKATGCRQLIGYGDADNGFFFIQDGIQGLGIMYRNSSSGVVVETFVPQSSWNVDKLDGTGQSGITLDSTKGNIYGCDLEWLGMGQVRMFVVLSGKPVVVHVFDNANVKSTVYMTTANLPVRWEIHAYAAIAAPVSMLHTCASVSAEGDIGNKGIVRSVNTGVTTQTVTGTRRPLLSLRLKTANIRAALRLLGYQVAPASNTGILYELYLNPTLTTPSWVSAPGFGEYDISSTAVTVTNATLINSGYCFNSNGGTSENNFLSEMIQWIAANIAGTSDIMTITATSAGNNVACYAAMTYSEVV